MTNEITYHADPNVIKYISDKVHDGFYYLGLGDKISPGADLNDYKTYGKYVWNDWFGDSPINTPFSKNVSFDLIVESAWRSSSEYRQTIRSTFDQITFTRVTTDNTTKWTNWVCIGGVDAIVAEGTTNGWNWIKFASGHAIIWGRDSFTMTSTTAAHIIPSLPFEVRYVYPSVSVTASGYPQNVKVDSNLNHGNFINSFNIWATSASSTSHTFIASIIIFCDWK